MAGNGVTAPKSRVFPSPVDSETMKRNDIMYAVIQTGGKQYRVQNDEVIFIEKLDAEANDTVTFDVVALGSEDGIKVGTPFVEGAKVTAEVVKNGKGKKIRVATYKPKKGEKRVMGHRQPYTQVKITSIEA